MHQIVCRLGLRPTPLGFAPRPTGGAYSAPPDSLAVLRGPTSKGREGESRGGEGERRGRERRRGEGDERGGEFVLCPRKILHVL